ncbi:MAG: PA2169 family four-helix-bundle protein [Aquabacterium sp.]
MQAEFVLDTMHYLIDASRGAEQQFLLYARQSRNEGIRAGFTDRARRARETTGALLTHVEQLGGRLPVKAVLLHRLQNWWVRGRVALLGQSDQAWLEACNRTEAGLLRRYRSVMQTSVLPSPVQTTVDRQYHAWQRIHHQMHVMHGALKASA